MHESHQNTERRSQEHSWDYFGRESKTVKDCGELVVMIINVAGGGVQKPVNLERRKSQKYKKQG